jgi:hypothetical protein
LDGGIFGFLGLIARHRGAVEYDWRTRFGRGLRSIGDDMTLAEAARLGVILCADPSSAAFAAAAGWDHPISREALILMDSFDLQMTVAASGSKGSKPKPHPGRPYKSSDKSVTKKGNVGGRTRAEVVAILNAHGHALPV